MKLAFILVFLSGILSVQALDSGKVTVLNKGIGGNNTEDALKRFERDVIQLKPDYLIVYLGMNDALNSGKLVPIEKYEANLQRIIDSAAKNGINNIMLVSLHPVIEKYLKKRHPGHPAGDLNSHVEKYNETLLRIAARNKLPVADLRTLIKSKGGATEDKSSLLRNIANSKSEDGIHLTPDAYRQMAQLFIPLFKGRIKAGDTVICFGDSLTYGAHVKGAGTSDGDTYPAQLSLILNKLVSAP